MGPLFKTTFRQAESNDARQHIPHEERDQPGRRNQEDDQKKEAPVWEDDTLVSLEALRSFLINFMKTLPGGEDLAKEETQRQEKRLSRNRPKEAMRPTSTHNAKAVRAYQSMAAKVEEKGDSTELPDEGGYQKQHAGLLQSKELRDIYGLIDDLESLRRQGVEQVHIKKADSFILALKNAVDLLKSKI